MLLGAILACGGTTVTPEPPTQVPPTEAPPGKTGEEASPQGGKESSGKGSMGEGATVPGTGTVNLTMINDLGTEVCFVVISPNNATNWGDDWLGDSETVLPGGRRAFEVTPGVWDMAAVDCDLNYLAEEYGVYINSDTTWMLSASASPASASTGSYDLTVLNHSSVDVCYVYITPLTADSWGPDWLGSDIIPAGTSYTFYVNSGTWDMQAVGCDMAVLNEQYNVTINGSYQWELYDEIGTPGGVSMEIINNLPEDICYVYFSPAGSSSWGEDWLGSETIASGTSYYFYMPAGTYDMLAEDCYGIDSTVEYGVTIDNDMWWEINTWDGSTSGGSTYYSFDIINNLPEDICIINISPSNADSWGEDWLGGDVIPAGTTYTFYYVYAGTYDLRAIDCYNFDSTVEYGVTVNDDMWWEINTWD